MERKQLSKMTPCNIIKLKTPLWNGGKRMVGIADYKIGQHNEIRIEMKDKEGTPLYPNSFYINGQDARKYEAVALPKYPSMKLRHIPIEELMILERV